MNKFRQYTPAFVERTDENEVAFETLKELLSIPLLKEWASHPNFYRFSVDTQGWEKTDPKTMLMVEYDNGYTWYVAGFLEKEIPELPGWQPKYGKIKHED